MPVVTPNTPSRVGRAEAAPASAQAAGKLIWIPVVAMVFTAIYSPLTDALSTADFNEKFAAADAGRLENKIFWLLIALPPLFALVRNPRIVFNANLPRSLLPLFLFLLLAGMSVLWAFDPSISFRRYTQQILLMATLVVPMFLAPRSFDFLWRIYLVFVAGAVINFFFVLGGTQTISGKALIGYQGYLSHKNVLGEFAAFCMFFSLYEITRGRGRRILGLLMLGLSVFLLVKANSKTSLALAGILPVFVLLLIYGGRVTRLSPATILFALLATAVAACVVASISIYDISEKIYGDRTFTARTELWDFVSAEIARKPWFGWGFQSFWLVGPEGPSRTDGFGWIRNMPTAHNGYLDILVTTGRVGFALFVPYIVLTLFAIGRLAKHDVARAWLLMCLITFIAITNFLESTWLEGQSFYWSIFVILSVDAALCARDVSGVKPVRSRARARAARAPSAPPRPPQPAAALSVRERSRLAAGRVRPDRRS